MLDSTRKRETPEGIDLSFAPAGPLVRSAAWSIDFAIRFAIYFSLAVVLGMFGRTGEGLFLILVFSLEWLYPIIFEARTGQTPGKKRMGIRVINDDGTPPSWQACLVRNLLRFVDFLPFFYATGLISSFLNKDFKRLGDLVAGTLVIHDPYENTATAKDQQINAKPMPMVLTFKEQHAIVQFSERQSLLTQSRQQELASVLSPILPKTATNTAQANEAELLHSYAAWLSGKGL